MKKLEDLKVDILDGKLSKFYVFYGEDFGIRKHYINKISTFFSEPPQYTNDFKTIQISGGLRALFGSREKLVVIYGDEEFAKQSETDIQRFIDKLRDFTCIFDYEEPLPNTNLFKNFDQYITYFPIVQDNIAVEFVQSELKLDDNNTKQMAHNCANNYNNILLESDKVHSYGLSKQLSDQNAYEALKLKNQLLEKVDEFSVSDFMNDILLRNTHNFPYWYEVVKNNSDKFFGSLTFMFNDFLIAALVKRYGKYKGSEYAYICKLSWNRTKVIREFFIPYDANYLYECAYKISGYDIDIKKGRIDREKLIDYFFSEIV